LPATGKFYSQVEWRGGCGFPDAAIVVQITERFAEEFEQSFAQPGLPYFRGA